MTPQQALTEIFTYYTDVAGMVTVDRLPGVESTKNGLMQTGFIGTMASELGIITDYERTDVYETIKSCQDESNPGAFDRYPQIGDRPRVQDPNAHDDARGVAAVSKLLRFQFHTTMLFEGIKRFFYYDNTNGREPGFWAWRGRMVIDILWYFLLNSTIRVIVMIMWPLITPLLMLVLYLKAGSGDYTEILDYMIVASMSKDSLVWRAFRRPYMRKNKLTDATLSYFKVGHPAIILAKKVKEL